MTKGSVLLAAVGALVVASCDPPPEFVASLSDPGSVEYDESVLGHWYYLDVEKQPDLTSFASVTGGSGGDLEIRLLWGNALWRFAAFPSRVDDVLYYNLVRKQSQDTMDYTAPGAKPGHIIVRAIHPSPETMLVCVLLWGKPWEGEKTLSEALTNTGLSPRFAKVIPRINGNPADTGEGLLHTLIEGSREHLLRLVRKNPAFHFGAVFVFTRLGTAWPEKELEHAALLKHEGECRIKD